jgi:hypothetical protein
MMGQYQNQQKSLQHLSCHQNPVEDPLFSFLQNHHKKAVRPTVKMFFF